MWKFSPQVLLVACWVVCNVETTLAYPSGEVSGACVGITPGAPHGVESSGDGGMSVVFNGSAGEYRAGRTYTVRLSRSSGNFRGLFCQFLNPMSSDSDRSYVGEVASAPNGTRRQDCGNVLNAGISHSNANDKTSVEYQWTASGETPASIMIKCSVVITKLQWYRIQSGPLNLVGPPNSATTESSETAAETPGLMIDLASCGQSKGCRRVPVGCNTPAECSFIYTQQLIDSNTVQIELSAQAQGWVAVGYSQDTRMGSDDVLACQADSSNRVHAKDLYNLGFSSVTDGVGTSPSDGLTNVETSLSNGVITCRFSRAISGNGDRDRDLRLNHTLFFGTHPTARASANSALGTQHVVIPALSATTVAVTSNFSIGSQPFDKRLIVAHGVMMTYSWLALSTNGMFTARFLRGAYPPPRWFQIHWVVMTLAITLAVAAAIVIGVHVGTFRSNAHAGLGITVLVLAGLQAAIAQIRPAPDAGEKRRMFTMLHRGLGSLTQILAWVTLFLGLGEASSSLVITGTFYGVLAGGVAGVILLWLYLEYRKANLADGDKSDNVFISRSSYLFAAISYGFTVSLGSLLWGADVRQ